MQKAFPVKRISKKPRRRTIARRQRKVAARHAQVPMVGIFAYPPEKVH